MMIENETKAVELAIKFHETYERLAPDFGYETREDTKEFDTESPNGQLMIAVCLNVLEWLNHYEYVKSLKRLNAVLTKEN